MAIPPCDALAAVYDNFVDPAHVRLLREVLLSILQGDIAAGAVNTRITRWQPLDESEGTPLPAALSRAVDRVFVAARECHEADLVDGIVGVEWWAQYVAPTAGVPMHIDQDQMIAQSFHGRHRASRDGHLRTPLLSTIIYFDSIASPTLVLDQRYAWCDDAGTTGLWLKEPPVPREAMVVYPRPGRANALRWPEAACSDRRGCAASASWSAAKPEHVCKAHRRRMRRLRAPRLWLVPRRRPLRTGRGVQWVRELV